MGGWLLTVAAGLEYLFAKPSHAPAHGSEDEDSEDGDENSGHGADAEEEKEARAREEAGNDWMVEQGFDRKE